MHTVSTTDRILDKENKLRIGNINLEVMGIVWTRL